MAEGQIEQIRSIFDGIPSELLSFEEFVGFDRSYRNLFTLDEHRKILQMSCYRCNRKTFSLMPFSISIRIVFMFSNLEEILSVDQE